ncbi:MAG: ankyrin repeat domain-containing protein [Cetobacterium sp.]
MIKKTLPTELLTRILMYLENHLDKISMTSKVMFNITKNVKQILIKNFIDNNHYMKTITFRHEDSEGYQFIDFPTYLLLNGDYYKYINKNLDMYKDMMFRRATRRNDWRIIKFMIKLERLNFIDLELLHESGLFLATENNNLEVLKILLEQSNYINVVNYENNVLLRIAIARDHIDIFKYLLTFDIIKNSVNWDELSILATKNKSIHILKLIFE